jgi:hypothetical protein
MKETGMAIRQWWKRLAALCLLGLLAGCAATGSPTRPPEIVLPLVAGWYQGQRVYYVTTDISDAGMAAAGQANFVPRLAAALPPGRPAPGTPLAYERIYKFVNADQPSVLPSVPQPLGGANANRAYSPLWQLYAVRWLPDQPRKELRSEEEVLAAQERGWVALEPLPILVNCPVVQVGDTLLPGARRL